MVELTYRVTGNRVEYSIPGQGLGGVDPTVHHVGGEEEAYNRFYFSGRGKKRVGKVDLPVAAGMEYTAVVLDMTNYTDPPASWPEISNKVVYTVGAA